MTFTAGPDPVAYSPGSAIVRLGTTPDTIERNQALLESLTRPREGQQFQIASVERLVTPDGQRESRLSNFATVRTLRTPAPVAVRELRAQGFDAQLHHVFFAHCAGGCCGPHPSIAGGVAGSPVYASPVYASPVYASPVYASPVYASPVYASPVYASPVYASGAAKATGIHRSSARAATAEEAAEMAASLAGAAIPPANPVDVFVLDTGLPTDAFRPSTLGTPHTLSSTVDEPDAVPDNRLDPAAGHGEFIAGLIKSLEPKCQVAVAKVLSTLGDGDEVTISQAIYHLPAPQARGSILNLSFGGYVLDTGALMIADAIADAQARGWVVVASAGNDATCRPTYPAALPDVIGVGAIGPYGPAPFTNYGPWVRACAPGVDLVSTFFTDFDADTETGPFTGWARWSGTSFSAPIVAGALMHEMISRGVTAGVAVQRLIDAPALMRLRDLGTAVNQV